ncbi:VHS domain-containing protein [Hysterangium stoloniferum]|nr:VHS domain-containing protein [Hysterangium stoloniferum]
MLNNGWINVSQVEVLVQRACDPIIHEPNYAVHLELAEYINNKKANSPREAAMAVVRLINHRNPHIAILALSLLHTLVESCGYPFHLQISTKEFLNELVRRFPERPPPFPGPVMSRILEIIHGWKEGICTTSRWKEDLGNIRDMHRLLSFKGYRFHDAARSSASASEELKSADELESEDREAQAAKLQELIRRGTPRDLAAAQELMKVMAGADPDAKPDYRTQALKELNKLEQKVVLLNEMFDNVDFEGRERFAAGDVYDQVATPLISARPKLQKWISDAEADDPESLAIFLQINDQINNVLGRFESFKKGDYEGVARAVPANLGGSSVAVKSDLIDLLDDPAPAVSQSSNPANELAGLFGGISSPPAPVAGQSRNGGSPNLIGLAPGFGGIMLPGTPQPPQPQTQAHLGFQPTDSGSLQQPSQSRSQSQPQPQPHTQNKDPFADLAGLF